MHLLTDLLFFLITLGHTSPSSASAIAMFYSFVGNGKKNNTAPQLWLKYVMDNIHSTPAKDFKELLPPIDRQRADLKDVVGWGGYNPLKKETVNQIRRRFLCNSHSLFLLLFFFSRWFYACSSIVFALSNIQSSHSSFHCRFVALQRSLTFGNIGISCG